MVTDMEGVAGVVSFADQSFPDGRYYDAGKRLVTGEVNAAVDGLLDAGVEEVLVWDGHGAGGIDFDTLHPAALLLHGRPSPPWSRLQEVIGRYDAFVIVGQHAMAGVVTSNQNHTQNSRTVDAYRLNGTLIGEIGQLALFMGGLGLPLLFLSGERELALFMGLGLPLLFLSGERDGREAEELVPEITTVAVKEGLGRGSAISLSAKAARQRIRQGIAAAMARHRQNPIAPLVWPGPYLLEKRFFHTDTADAEMSKAGAERVDAQRVRFHSDEILDIVYR